MLRGAYNWKLTVRRVGDGVELLRAATCDERAELPETLWGLPVTALGARALSPEAREADGEQVRILYGPADSGNWDNQNLRELSLPPALQRVGDYALYNCRNLSRLRVHDTETHWGSAVLMNCRELDAIEIIRHDRRDCGTLCYFAGELNRELDISIIQAGETALRLIFPEYRELYEENAPAHHFDYTIQGYGYPYHHCFRERRFELIEYDRLWPKLKDTEGSAPLRLAWYRLRYPEGLTAEARSVYVDYLRGHGSAAAVWLVRERDPAGLARFLKAIPVDCAALDEALSAARELRETEAAAFLLEAKRRQFPERAKDRFAL